ncbi:class I SAM-dependent methyltransferase [Virgibacillus xinjiangensis]|uniref:Class I SAM-dependent methyltransferase n=1 Tax=Virgibacillus xinjiangensis TaxID=393090 RepID=A0ABV7CT05_9BACI
MMVKGILDYAHELLKNSVEHGDIVVDATCGNGHDTVFLSRLTGPEGKVYAFDVQQQAIQNTKQSLADAACHNVTLIHDSHAHASAYLPDKEIGGAIFNLGYLPRSDKSVVTRGSSTTEALTTLLSRMGKGKMTVLVVYHGHQGGREEKEAVLEYLEQLDQQTYTVLQYAFINQKNDPPFIVAVQKK